MKPITVSLFFVLFFCNQQLNAHALFVFGPQTSNKNWLKTSTRIYTEIKKQLAKKSEAVDFYPQKVASGLFAFLQTKYSQQEITQLYHDSLNDLSQKFAVTIINTCEKLAPTATLSLVSYGQGVRVVQKAMVCLTTHARGIKAFRKIKNAFAVEQEGFSYLPIPEATQTEQIRKTTFLNTLFGKFILLDADDFGRSKLSAIPLLSNNEDIALATIVAELQTLTNKKK